ncbi:hypothetical protein VNO77_13958 [Canavalia gladiata]|uniref:Uncharacterized protein n=1 Tax=Canavalia gladiata TaxID=3824 RepID=A0AAN9QNI9_CANGL
MKKCVFGSEFAQVRANMEALKLKIGSRSYLYPGSNKAHVEGLYGLFGSKFSCPTMDFSNLFKAKFALKLKCRTLPYDFVCFWNEWYFATDPHLPSASAVDFDHERA